MSWTDFFPVLTNEHIDEYHANASASEREEYASWFTEERIINEKPSGHVVSFSLFWKNVRGNEPDLPKLDRQTLRNATGMGLVRRFEPWAHYVVPLFNAAKLINEKYDEVTVRVYLAKDLEFLVPDLVDAGCEVRLMRSSSIRHNPGAMWRFLALADEGLVTIADADRGSLVIADIERTALMSRIGLGFWRVPVWGEIRGDNEVSYRPILALQFGSAMSIDIRPLLEALVWHTQRRSITLKCSPPGGCEERPIIGTRWPDYGFDEWFLMAAVYPRAAQNGLLSFIPASARSRFLLVDIEYATWANSRAEIHFFGTDAKCCSPPSAVEAEAAAEATAQ